MPPPNRIKTRRLRTTILCSSMALKLGMLLFGPCPALLAQSAYDSPYRFTTIGKTESLSNPKVTSLFQDSYGFIWIGTQGGLYRFDGYQCRLFEHQPDDSTSLTSNAIAYQAFYEDEQGNLWIATADAGFVKFDRRTERFHRYQASPGGLTFDALNALCSDGTGGLWIGSKNGLNHFFPDKNRFDRYRLADKDLDTLMGSNLILALHRASDRRFWMGTGRGVAVLDTAGRFQRFFPDPERPGALSSDYAMSIFEDSRHQIWIATKNGLNRWVEKDSFVRYFPADRLQLPNNSGYNYIIRVFEDQDGAFWLGTNSGLLRFYPQTDRYEIIRHVRFDPASIGEGPVRGVLEDQAGRLWFATNGGASILDKKTARVQDQTWRTVQTQLAVAEHAADINIKSLAETGRRTWVSTENGLYSFLPGEALQQFLPGAFFRLFVDQKGHLWAGTVQDVFFVIDPIHMRILDTIKKSIRVEPRDQFHPVGLQNTAFAEDAYGGLWMGAYSTLNRYDPVKKQYRQYYSQPGHNQRLSHSGINDLYCDRQGRLWIATWGGLNALSPDQLKAAFEGATPFFENYLHNPQDTNSISNDRIRCILEDHLGRMWFGTDVGLNVRHADGRWQRFFRKNGLPENCITGLLEDDNGHIWASTLNSGLARFNPVSGTFIHLTTKEGLNTDQYLSGACLKTSNGMIVFGGYNGINGFDPHNIVAGTDTLPLRFVALKLNNRPVYPSDGSTYLRQPVYMTDKLTLDFDSKVITLQVAALNTPNPELQVYRYRLDGLWASQGWINLGNQREITFTNLFPGRYVLRVESTASPDGREHWESGAELIIWVKFPWIQFGSIAGLLAIILYTIYKLRLKRKLAAAEAQRLGELNTVKTRLYTNITHEFRTPLTVILGETAQLEKQGGQTLKNGLTAINRQGRRLLHLVNQMLDLAKVEAGSMAPNMIQDDIVLFLKYLLESFRSLAGEKQIDLHFDADTPEFRMDFDPDKYQKIVANLLSNALKFTPAGGQVTLRINCSLKISGQSMLTIQVEDSGIGISTDNLPFIFNRFYQADNSSTRAGEGTGIGLTLTKEMVRLLGGHIRVESRPGSGSIFTIALPVTRTAPQKPAEENHFPANHDSGVVAWTTPAYESQPDQPAYKTRPQLLLLEDNPDVVRYLSGLLAGAYQLHLAGNGKAGLEMAREVIPDLVLSDVMMPEMDGFEVCRQLKTDARTSHIPVVLLTAKADLDSRIEGLEHGADAYLAKPFEARELKVQLRKLLELRQTLQVYYRSPAFWTAPPAHPHRPLDDAFLLQVKSLIEADLTRSWTIDELTGALFVSHSQLHRKLEALTGMHTTEFVRYIRLLHAGRLLTEQPNEKIATIAADAGFGSPNEFSNRFREVFGCSPSEWRARGGV